MRNSAGLVIRDSLTCLDDGRAGSADEDEDDEEVEKVIVITKACACARSHLPTCTVSSARTERAVSEGLAARTTVPYLAPSHTRQRAIRIGLGTT